MLGLVLAVALAQPAPDFAGTWELDPTASDDLAPLASALGFSKWMLAMMPAKPVQELSLDGEALVISAQGIKGRRTERFRFDGKTPTRAELLGMPFEVISTLEEGAITSKGTLEKDGKRLPLQLRRTASQDTMRVVITLGEVKLVRIYKRLPPAR
jgi:hypothetical protein